MAVSLKDISQRTHINICSVSQVLNNHPKAERLRQETRDKILLAAKELGYCRNEAAATIRKKRSNVLAFVTSEMGSIEYTGRIQNGVLHAASECGYTITVHSLAKNSTEALAGKLLGWRVAGVIFHVAKLDSIAEIIQILNKESIPWGTVNLSNPGGIGFTSDDSKGMEDAVRSLAEEGHTRIAYFSNSRNMNSDYQFIRYNGYMEGLKKYLSSFPGKLYFLRTPSDLYDLEFAASLTEEIRREKIDAVVCESDHLALLLLRGAQIHHIKVPGELSLIGFGDGALAENAYPSLTTLHQDFEEMGTATVKELVKRLSCKKITSEKECAMFPVKLVKRSSTCIQNKK